MLQYGGNQNTRRNDRSYQWNICWLLQPQVKYLLKQCFIITFALFKVFKAFIIFILIQSVRITWIVVLRCNARCSSWSILWEVLCSLIWGRSLSRRLRLLIKEQINMLYQWRHFRESLCVGIYYLILVDSIFFPQWVVGDVVSCRIHCEGIFTPDKWLNI